jgi:hypothetical protein
MAFTVYGCPLPCRNTGLPEPERLSVGFRSLALSLVSNVENRVKGFFEVKYILQTIGPIYDVAGARELSNTM